MPVSDPLQHFFGWFSALQRIHPFHKNPSRTQRNSAQQWGSADALRDTNQLLQPKVESALPLPIARMNGSAGHSAKWMLSTRMMLGAQHYFVMFSPALTGSFGGQQAVLTVDRYTTFSYGGHHTLKTRFTNNAEAPLSLA